MNTKWFLIGALVGGVWAAIFVNSLIGYSVDMFGTRDNCRAVNPGYECNWGWVKTYPFEPSREAANP